MVLESFNRKLFLLINTDCNLSIWKINSVIFLAKYLIVLIIIFLSIIFFKNIFLAIKTFISLIFSLIIIFLLNTFFPYPRPFSFGIGYQCLEHIVNSSYPSKHATIIFTISISFFIWHRFLYAAILFFLAFIVSWARIFLGIHWPLDIFGSFLTSLVSCILSYIIYMLILKKYF